MPRRSRTNTAGNIDLQGVWEALFPRLGALHRDVFPKSTSCKCLIAVLVTANVAKYFPAGLSVALVVVSCRCWPWQMWDATSRLGEGAFDPQIQGWKTVRDSPKAESDRNGVYFICAICAMLVCFGPPLQARQQFS